MSSDTARDSFSSTTPAPRDSAPFVVVRAALAPMNGEPRVSSSQTSQALAGHVLLVYGESGDWLDLVGADGYRGWVHRGYLTHVPTAAAMAPLGVAVSMTTAEARDAWLPGPVRVPRGARNERAGRVSLGCRVEARDRGATSLPLGALVPDDATIVDGRAIPCDELSRRFPLEPEAVVRSALEFFAGTSYQWGGITPWGADCSGLVQSVFALHGRLLPRDAWQQALVGEDAGADLGQFRPADLLFFSEREDRRITHVGISLGGARIVHLALGRGGYALDRLDDASDDYATRLAGRFVCARRIIPPDRA